MIEVKVAAPEVRLAVTSIDGTGSVGSDPATWSVALSTFEPAGIAWWLLRSARAQPPTARATTAAAATSEVTTRRRARLRRPVAIAAYGSIDIGGAGAVLSSSRRSSDMGVSFGEGGAQLGQTA
jgi:hypothetical protein